MSFDFRLRSGDLSIVNGDFEQIKDSPKLIQDILKIATTQAGTNPFAPWYGSLLSRTMIGSILPDGIIITAAQGQLQLAISALQNMQAIQIQQRQTLSADEQLAAVLGIQVGRSPVDQRLFQVKISVVTKSYRSTSVAFTVSTF